MSDVNTNLMGLDDLAAEQGDRIARYEEALRIATFHRDHWRQQEADRRQELEDISVQFQEMSQRFADFGSANSVLREQLEQAERRGVDLQTELIRAHSEAGRLVAAVGELNAKDERRQVEIDELRAEAAELRQELGSARQLMDGWAGRRSAWSQLCLDGTPAERMAAAFLIRVCFHDMPISDAFASLGRQVVGQAGSFTQQIGGPGLPPMSVEPAPGSRPGGSAHVDDPQAGINVDDPQESARPCSPTDPAPDQPAEHMPVLDWHGLDDANLLFKESFYLQKYPDIAAGSTDGFEHYRITGWHEGRQPHGLFDVDHYRQQLQEGEWPLDPVRHYLEVGYKTGLQPCRLFDEPWYRQQYGIDQDQSCLVHYLREGQFNGLWPNAQFDPVAYARRYPDASAGALSPIEHFLTQRQVSIMPLGPLWTKEDYAAHGPMLTRLAGILNQRR